MIMKNEVFWILPQSHKVLHPSKLHPASKHYARVEVTDDEKHDSLLDYGCRKFYSAGSMCQCDKPFLPLVTDAPVK